MKSGVILSTYLVELNLLGLYKIYKMAYNK